MARRDAASVEALRSLAADIITTDYLNLGGLTLSNVLEIMLTNGSDKLMIVSLNGGTTDHAQLPPQSDLPLRPGAYDHALEGGIQIAVKLHVAGAAAVNTLVTAVVIITKPLTI